MKQIDEEYNEIMSINSSDQNEETDLDMYEYSLNENNELNKNDNEINEDSAPHNETPPDRIDKLHNNPNITHKEPIDPSVTYVTKSVR